MSDVGREIVDGMSEFLDRLKATTPTADRIFDVLIRCAGASEISRPEFRAFMASARPIEFRFQGSLGFGGKFWTERWAVTCYPEDATPERLQTIEGTNEALTQLRREMEG